MCLLVIKLTRSLLRKLELTLFWPGFHFKGDTAFIIFLKGAAKCHHDVEDTSRLCFTSNVSIYYGFACFSLFSLLSCLLNYESHFATLNFCKFPLFNILCIKTWKRNVYLSLTLRLYFVYHLFKYFLEMCIL